MLNQPFAGSLVVLYVGIAIFLLAAVGIGLFVSAFATTMQQAMLSGQSDALGAANVVLAQLTKSHPELEIEPKLTLRHQPNGIALRRADTDLRQWVDTFIFYIKNNGELDAICQKWLGTPLPELPTF